MQITYLELSDAADILEAAEVLAVLEGPGVSRTHVLKAVEGRDIILIIDGATGGAMMIDECKHDAESGGSVHHHARAIAANS